jgi:hypothetical protein
MTGRLKSTGHRSRQVFEKVVDRATTLHLIVILGVAGIGLDMWLGTEHYSFVDIIIVSVLFVILGVTFELARNFFGLTKEVGILRKDFFEHAPIKTCWNETATVAVLRELDGLAKSGSTVKAVWGALAFSDDFADFVGGQLSSLTETGYSVERWVDISKVKYEHVAAHLEGAVEAMRKGHYTLHLVRDAQFGALVIDSDAAAINFQAHPERPEIIGVYGADKSLAQRVLTMIGELDQGLRLPGKDPRSTSIASLQEKAKKYYTESRQADG